MQEPDSALLLQASLRASRRRRRYALAAVLVLVAVAALAAVLTYQTRRHERPLTEQARAVRARAVLAMQRALAQENLAMQARLRARAAAKR
jgi:flagellar biosynthesis/type III secretory pathway M-ring protein FliF/YscJ